MDLVLRQHKGRVRISGLPLPHPHDNRISEALAPARQHNRLLYRRVLPPGELRLGRLGVEVAGSQAEVRRRPYISDLPGYDVAVLPFAVALGTRVETYPRAQEHQAT